MTAPAPPLPAPLSFVYRDGERPRFEALARRRLSRSLAWEPFWGVLMLMVFVIGLAVFGMQKAGFLPPAHLRTALVTAFTAFAGGVVLTMLLFALQSRRLVREDGRDKVVWELAFADDGFTLKSELFETRFPWRTVRSVDLEPGAVFIWFGPAESLPIPARLFRDDAACRDFATALQARVRQAA